MARPDLMWRGPTWTRQSLRRGTYGPERNDTEVTIRLPRPKVTAISSVGPVHGDHRASFQSQPS
jgi:hypothetical protein